MTASYLQNNDYTPLQMRRPYQLNVNDVAQTVATLDSYWKQGAARVKAQYENVAGLNLTLNSNKQYASDFLKQAQEQMKKLSTKRLDDRAVQQEGLNIFNPILEDQNIKLDHTITNLRQSIISEAQAFKTKDGGKGYADENLADALSTFKDFGANTDPNQLGAIYEKAKNARYIPYYDVQKELIYIRDKCGEVSGTQVGGLQNSSGVYDLNISGTPSEKLRTCLEGLSPQANTQLAISGRVRYGQDYESLGRDLLLANNKLKESYSKQISDTDAIVTSKKIGTGEKQRDLTTQEITAITETKTNLQARIFRFFR